MNRRQHVAALLGLGALPVRAAIGPKYSAALQTALEGTHVYLGVTPLPASDSRWDEVARLLDKAPTSGSPYGVADYLRTKVPKKYQEAWPEDYANPLVMNLFFATGTKPVGDTTPWCAAFANWCLSRCGMKGTGRADAVSFAGWGASVWHKDEGPLPTKLNRGDLAVFRRKSDPTHGHVAFVHQVSQTFPDTIDVLGGNQVSKGIHRVSIDPFSTKGDLEFLTVRTTKGMQSS